MYQQVGSRYRALLCRLALPLQWGALMHRHMTWGCNEPYRLLPPKLHRARTCRGSPPGCSRSSGCAPCCAARTRRSCSRGSQATARRVQLSQPGQRPPNLHVACHAYRWGPPHASQIPGQPFGLSPVTGPVDDALVLLGRGGLDWARLRAASCRGGRLGRSALLPATPPLRWSLLPALIFPRCCCWWRGRPRFCLRRRRRCCWCRRLASCHGHLCGRPRSRCQLLRGWCWCGRSSLGCCRLPCLRPGRRRDRTRCGRCSRCLLLCSSWLASRAPLAPPLAGRCFPSLLRLLLLRLLRRTAVLGLLLCRPNSRLRLGRRRPSRRHR